MQTSIKEKKECSFNISYRNFEQMKLPAIEKDIR